jgi:hypothetical protein
MLAVDRRLSAQRALFMRGSLSASIAGAAAVALTGLLWVDAFSQDLEDLARDGYGVLMTTEVQGEFEGCEYGRRIPLDNGLVFVCSSYSYHYAYQPEVLILKSVQSGDVKVMIDGEEFDGTLYRQ